MLSYFVLTKLCVTVTKGAITGADYTGHESIIDLLFGSYIITATELMKALGSIEIVCTTDGPRSSRSDGRRGQR